MIFTEGYPLVFCSIIYLIIVSLERFSVVEQKKERVHRLGKWQRCLNSCLNFLDVTPFIFAIISDGLMDGGAFKKICTWSGIVLRVIMFTSIS